MDVVPVVIARLIGADLKYAVRLVIVILDDDVDDRDDAVRGIARRQSATIPVLQITHDRGFTGRERAPLWRSHIGARHDMADDLIPPAMAGDDDKIVRLGAILPNLAEGHTEAIGADPRRLGQDFRQIRHAECEAAEAGDGRLLAQRLLACCSGVNHWRMVRRAAVRRQSPRIVGPNRQPRVRQPKPSAPEFPPARRSNRCDLAKSCPRTIETPWDDSETTRPSNRLLRLHLSSPAAPCKFARTLAVSLSGSTRCQPGPTENCFAAQCGRIGSGRTLRVILPILQNPDRLMHPRPIATSRASKS